ncbi:MAG: EAL domain-containing protein [Lachnospiraceae bacterium]|nr:EAL domain-containing protein [Lachnospiraceae bacterium]
MRADNNELQLHFLREISEGPVSLARFNEALGAVAYYLHIFGIEAEYVGDFKLSAGKRNILLYQRESGMPADEPLSFTFHMDPRRSVVIYIYPADKPFEESERDTLEMYATECMFYLARLRLDDDDHRFANQQQTTGLPNASGYLHNVTELMKKDIPFNIYCAFYFNLKDFGEINRVYGREKGDEVLWQYASYLNDFIEDDEALGHLGGDNFMALIKKTRRDKFIKLISNVTLMLDIDERSEDIHIASTIGIWDILSDVSDPGEVISRPSIALNQAKNVLHQSIAYASDNLITRISQQKTVLKDYEEALANEEFVVYYQPKVDSRNKMLVGAEALVRWIHDGKMVSPGVFIPALEENGQTLALDLYVLRHVCRDIVKWILMGYDPVPVSVNFSRKDLKDKKLVEKINEIIEQAKLDKKYIEVELTETVDEAEHGVLSGFISDLYQKNIMTAIDDFGSGYSALATLREFQIHTLKIDRSFVNGDDFSWKDEIILKDIIHMAHELGMDVLIEGVERADQLFFVNNAGCYVIQGYYYDRPLPKAEFEERLQNKQYKK